MRALSIDVLKLYDTGKESFEVDEHPRPQSTIETLAKLPAVFKKGGTVTAGNASVSSPYPDSPLDMSIRDMS